MEIFWIRTVSQLGIYAIFFIYLLWSLRRGAQEWAPLIGAVLYALLFEHLNILRSQPAVGGYHYHPASWFFLLGDTPLYIPLAWSFILGTSRRLTDSFAVRAWARPCCDALLALLIDLSLDVVAIRLHFWYWHGISWDEGFFGVPASNFLGWLLVTFTYSGLTRALWETRHGAEKLSIVQKVALQWLAIPLLAFLFYRVLEAAANGVYSQLAPSDQRLQFFGLAVIVGLFLLAVRLGRQAAQKKKGVGAERLDLGTLHLPRHSFHVFGLIGLLFVPAGLFSPVLLALTLAVWLLEIGICLSFL